MAKVITFSRVFPSYHPRKGEPTFFVEKIWNSIAYMPEIYMEQFPIPYAELGIDFSKVKDTKHHTIRAGNRWKEGDWFSPRVWSGKPYNSKQVVFAPDIQIKKVFHFEIDNYRFIINGNLFYHQCVSEWHDSIETLCKNDGLTVIDLFDWFKIPCKFEGQIICWNNEIQY